MAKSGAFLTGDKELDAILRTFPDKELKSAIRTATRETIKKNVLPRAKQIIESSGRVDTRAAVDSLKVRAAQVKRRSGTFGAQLDFGPREKAPELRRARGGRIGWDKKRNEPVFHPGLLEYGSDDELPLAPLRTGLCGAVQATLAEFRTHLRASLVKVAARAKLKGK